MPGPNVSFDVYNPQSTNMSGSQAEQVNQMIQIAQLLYGVGHSIGQQHAQNTALKQLGVLKPANQIAGYQAKPQDYMKAIQALGLNVKAPTQGTPQQQDQMMSDFLTRKNSMAQQMGNKPAAMPGSNMVLDPNAFKAMGGQLSGGDITLNPAAMNKQGSLLNLFGSPEAEGQALSEANKTAPEGYVAKVNPKLPGGVEYVYNSTQSGNKTVEGQANDIYSGIKSGNVSPLMDDITGMNAGKIKTAVVARAAKEGYDLKDLQLQYRATKQLTSTMNQNQMVQLRTALNSTQGDIQPLRDLSNEFDRVGWTPANKVILGARLQGIDLGDGRKVNSPQYDISPEAMKSMNPDQVQVATKFVTQLNLMKDNLAVSFMRGGVPTDQAFKLTDKILNPAYGNDQLNAGLDQVQVNLNIRNNAASSVQPFVPGQGQGFMSNQPNPNTINNVLQAKGGQQSQQALKVGTIKKGYAYKGGDPASPDSWSKI